MEVLVRGDEAGFAVHSVIVMRRAAFDVADEFVDQRQILPVLVGFPVPGGVGGAFCDNRGFGGGGHDVFSVGG